MSPRFFQHFAKMLDVSPYRTVYDEHKFIQHKKEEKKIRPVGFDSTDYGNDWPNQTKVATGSMCMLVFGNKLLTG